MAHDNDIGQTVGLTDSVAVEPPAGIYAIASAPVVISKKSIAAVALTAALIGVSALVATAGEGGGEVTINQNNGTFENTMAPTVSPTTATPTFNPTTATPSVSPTLSPTIAPNVNPTSLPTLSPSANPTLSPATPSPTTLSPSYAPTLQPTVDVSSESYVDNCTQDIYMFVDISPSIGPKKEAMQREFAQTAIGRVFEYTQGAYHQVRFAVSSFAKKVYPIVQLDDDEATDPEYLKQEVEDLGQVRYTAHNEVFNTITLLSENRPLRASFNATTGRGLSVILITDGEPKIPDLSDAKAKVASQDAYLAMKQVFQDVKVWCFYPGQLTDSAYFESICNGFWQTEESLDDAQRSNIEAQTTTMSKIAASKICESVLVEEEEQESQRFTHVAP